MSGQILDAVFVKKCRKAHVCFWCGETIEIGTSYVHWAWVEDRNIEKIKVHPECKTGWNEAADDEGGIYYCIPGEHQRGKKSLYGENE